MSNQPYMCHEAEHAHLTREDAGRCYREQQRARLARCTRHVHDNPDESRECWINQLKAQASLVREDDEVLEQERTRKWGMALANLKAKLNILADGYYDACVAEGEPPENMTVDDFILATFQTMFDLYAIEGDTSQPREFLREWVKYNNFDPLPAQYTDQD